MGDGRLRCRRGRLGTGECAYGFELGGVAPAIVLFTPAVISGGIAEKIKRDNQLYTYRAVEAFMRGEDPDVASERNLEAGKVYWGKFAIKIIVSAFIGLCFGWGLVSILDKFVG